MDLFYFQTVSDFIAVSFFQALVLSCLQTIFNLVVDTVVNVSHFGSHNYIYSIYTRYTQLLGERPVTRVSPEGAEPRHHIERKGEGKLRPETQRSTTNEGGKGVVKVSRHTLYCGAGAVKTS